MPERTPRPPEDEGWRDIHLDDIARGVGTLIGFVSGVVSTVGSAVNQNRTAAARPLGGRPVARPWSPGPPAAPAPTREPLLDLFDEGDEFVLLVEWPDGDPALIEASARDDVLSLAFGAEAPAVDLLLPAVVDPASLRRRERNGTVAFRLRRAAPREEASR
jgi:hypothetical protein